MTGDFEVMPIGTAKRLERLEAVLKAAKFAQAVLWGSDGDKKGAIKYLDKAIAAVEQP